MMYPMVIFWRMGDPLIPCQAGLFDHKGGEGAVDDLQHRREQVRLGGEQMPQRDGKRHHSLAHRDLGDDVIDEMGGRFRHASDITAGQKPRRLQEKAMRVSWAHSPHRNISTPKTLRTRL